MGSGGLFITVFSSLALILVALELDELAIVSWLLGLGIFATLL